MGHQIEFKATTGEEYGPPPKEKKDPPGGGGAAPDDAAALQASSEKNRAKNEAKKAAKEAKEAKKEQQRREREEREKAKVEKLAKEMGDSFGDAPMVQSQIVTDKKWTAVADLKPVMAQKTVLVRGFLQNTRSVGKGVFVVIRSTMFTVQGVCFQNDGRGISSEMVRYIAGLPAESIVDMEGTVTVPDQPVEACTQKMVEVQVSKFHCVTKAKRALPFQLEDAMRPDEVHETDIGAYVADDAAGPQRTDGMPTVGLENRLNNRWVDLRTPANQGIFRIQSMVGSLFRECLVAKGFVEMHAPKLIKGASEGGAEVFTLNYFNQTACLSMSPQLHKQMACACAGFERVFTTGPVFRAEKSNTRRHLCEFTGFDMEMVISEHYDEVMDVFSDLFIYIFDGINERCRNELEAVRTQHPFEDLKYLRPTLKLTYAEGCALLREAGAEQGDYEDLSTENEKRLGDIVRERYGTDFFFMDKYPLAVRPFYTMPDPANPLLSNSYDFFIRGQEILSGAQRIHEPEMLEERARAWGIDIGTLQEYIDSFRNGALPHGGGGIGLERVVMLFLGLPNIRKASWFPRDPERLAP
jgi:nondiscriminating aspartyl-tRNA synthetase